MKDSITSIANFQTKTSPRAYANSVVRFHHSFSFEDRVRAAEKAGWNVFQFPSAMLTGGDLLSDSGTTSLTLEQLSAMLLGDEAYGSNWGYFKLLERFEETFGISQNEWEVYLFHQGRSAEFALFNEISDKNSIIPSNGHFDTTHANIVGAQMEARNLYSNPEDVDPNFKGNINIQALEELLSNSDLNVPIVYTTITNNTGGGQPVSLENIRKASALCKKYKKPFFLDACRFAENAWFIKNREPNEKDRSVQEIIHETFSYCDGFTISLKKDGLSNMGGALLLKKESSFTEKYPKALNSIRDHQILVEGHPTYGGLTGRDIMVIAEGLKTVVTEEYLGSRISLVQQFGESLTSKGIPTLEPFGGHAVYIDIDKFFADTKLKREDFGGIALSALLLLKGIRLAELGAFAFGVFDPKTKKETFPKHNFLRAAIPRNKYEISDMNYVAECVGKLYEDRHKIPKAIPVYGRELSLRHFKARFELEYSA